MVQEQSQDQEFRKQANGKQEVHELTAPHKKHSPMFWVKSGQYRQEC